MNVLRVACVNPVLHYRLNVGLLQKGDAADFICVGSLDEFNVLETYIDGVRVAENSNSLIPHYNTIAVNNFSCSKKSPEAFRIKSSSSTIRVIEALDGQVITNELQLPARIINGYYESDIANDILKIVVVTRYNNDAQQQQQPAVGFIRNFGLKRGAIASSVAHDSHNMIAVGVDDEHISLAINALIDARGGLCVVENNEVVAEVLPLDIAGIMSSRDGYDVARLYSTLDAYAKHLGSKLGSPFMTLSFMSLLAVPQLKMSDKGLFDTRTFNFTDVAV
jgi:adenine deaminase